MEPLRIKGRTVKDAIVAALAVLKKSEAEVEVKVIEEGTQGILGMLGGKDAEVEVTERLGVAEMARQFLQEMLDRMKFITLVDIIKTEEDSVWADIKGEDIGRLIGRRGNTLDSLQYLAGIFLSKRMGKGIRLYLDASGYRERQARQLEEMAREAAEQVAASGKEYTFGELSAAERRIIHMELAKDERVFTISQGMRRDRHLMVVPKEKADEYQKDSFKAER